MSWLNKQQQFPLLQSSNIKFRQIYAKVVLMSKSSGDFGLENQNESIHHILDQIERTKRDIYSSMKRNTVADQIQFRSINKPKSNQKTMCYVPETKTVMAEDDNMQHSTALARKNGTETFFLLFSHQTKTPLQTLDAC